MSATLSPYERVALDWQARPRDRSLAEYEEIYKREGYLFVSPAFYVLCRPVRKYAPIENILSDEYRFDPATCDAWYVMQMAGDLGAALKLMPWQLPWICWVRDTDATGRLRFYETARVQRALGNQ